MPSVVIAAASSFGYVRGGPVSSYATSGSTSNSFVNSGDIFVGQSRSLDAGVTNYNRFRGFLKFPLTSIPAGALITEVTLSLALAVDLSTLNNFDIRIVKCNWAAQDPLSNGNREAAYDANLAAALDAVLRNTNGIATDTLYTTPALDASRLIPGSDVYYGINSSRDVGSNQPGSDGAEYIRIASPDYATSSLRPVLNVSYSLGSGVLLLDPDGMMM